MFIWKHYVGKMAVIIDENGKPLRHKTLNPELFEKLGQLYLREKKNRNGAHVTKNKRPAYRAKRHGSHLIAPRRGMNHIRLDASIIKPSRCPVHSKIALARPSNIPKPIGSNTRYLLSIQQLVAKEDPRHARTFYALLQKERKEQAYWRFKYEQLKMLMSNMARAGAQQQLYAEANKKGTKQ